MTETSPAAPLTEDERATMIELQQRDSTVAWQERESIRLADLERQSPVGAMIDALEQSGLTQLLEEGIAVLTDDEDAPVGDRLSRMLQILRFDGQAVSEHVRRLRHEEPRPQYLASLQP